MPKTEEYRLRPVGYENDPEEEKWELSTLDYCAAMVWCSFALIFKVNEEDQTEVISVLKKGLELTLSQARHYVGTVERGSDGVHSFVKKRDSTVLLAVQWLDKHEDGLPSFDEMEKTHFLSSKIGNIEVLSIPPMTYGEKPEASPDASPVVSAFKATFIRGGLILNMHHHHYANDIMGWSGFAHQLAENCYSIVNQSPATAWDPASLDHSRFTAPKMPEEAKIDGPPSPERHTDHLMSSSLLFHLPKSKAAELKKLATPNDGSWISTYDAFSALLWRVLTRLRVPIYKPEMTSSPLWGEAVNMRQRLNPPTPARMQRNVFFAALSTTAPSQLTTAEIISEVPLSRLAVYIRSLTKSITPEALQAALDMVAPIRNKTSLFIRVNSFAPMSLIMTDWRDSRVCEADFGFAKPAAYRHLMNTVTEGLIVVYPPRITGNEDEGCEFVISCENVLVRELVEDEEMKKYFEFRGVEAEEKPERPAVGVFGKLP